MTLGKKWLCLAVPVALIVLAESESSAYAQGFMQSPAGYAVRQSYNANGNTLGAGGARFRASSGLNPYYNYTGAGWAPYSYEAPLGSYMSGVADIVGAQGQWMQDAEQARLTREQVKSAKIDNKRKSFDEWLYEKQNTPTFQDDREFFQKEDLRRSRNDPPLNEVWSGLAMNNLLADVQKMSSTNVRGPDIPLDPNLVQQLNISSGSSPASLGLLRDGGKLHWPFVLSGSAYQSERQRLNELAPKALKQAAQSGAVEPDTLQGMIDAANSLDDQIKQNIDNITPTDYSVAKRYLRDLRSSFRALQDPNLAQTLKGASTIRATTVAQLVADMSRQGLQFAPATAGDEAAYLAVQRALASFDLAMADTLSSAQARSLQANAP